MKCRAMTSAERQREKRIFDHFRAEVIKEATELGNKLYEEKMDDALKRVQYIFFACLLEVGLSTKTVDRVTKAYPVMCERFANYKTDEIADFAFYNELKKRGVKVEMTKEEM